MADADDGCGTYTLLLGVGRATTVRFGAGGERELPAGGYAYTGSAFGPGGFDRLERHREVARGERAARHWHVDHLLNAAAARVAGDVRSARARIECAVAGRLRSHDATTPVGGVGASDCGCDTHLVRTPSAESVERAARAAHRRAR